MIISYICYFTFRDVWYTVESEEGGTGRFSGGFWITECFQLTSGMDSKYWIPPSQIKYIEKKGGR